MTKTRKKYGDVPKLLDTRVKRIERQCPPQGCCLEIHFKLVDDSGVVCESQDLDDLDDYLHRRRMERIRKKAMERYR